MTKGDRESGSEKTPAFRPGFRLSALDVGVLVVGATLFIYFFNRDPLTAWIVAAVFFHFFLFCNVFRVPRRLELIWAGIFTALVFSAAASPWFPWPAAIASIAIATVAVIILSIRLPSYHGILWAQLNPSLPEWWREFREHNG